MCHPLIVDSVLRRKKNHSTYMSYNNVRALPSQAEQVV